MAPTLKPRVLVSDKLSETAVNIFREKGIDVDFQPDLGKDKDALYDVIDQYDGLAIRSATKATAQKLQPPKQPRCEVIESLICSKAVILLPL